MPYFIQVPEDPEGVMLNRGLGTGGGATTNSPPPQEIIDLVESTGGQITYIPTPEGATPSDNPPLVYDKTNGREIETENGPTGDYTFPMPNEEAEIEIRFEFEYPDFTETVTFKFQWTPIRPAKDDIKAGGRERVIVCFSGGMIFDLDGETGSPVKQIYAPAGLWINWSWAFNNTIFFRAGGYSFGPGQIFYLDANDELVLFHASAFEGAHYLNTPPALYPDADGNLWTFEPKSSEVDYTGTGKYCKYSKQDFSLIKSGYIEASVFARDPAMAPGLNDNIYLCTEERLYEGPDMRTNQIVIEKYSSLAYSSKVWDVKIPFTPLPDEEWDFETHGEIYQSGGILSDYSGNVYALTYDEYRDYLSYVFVKLTKIFPSGVIDWSFSLGTAPDTSTSLFVTPGGVCILTSYNKVSVISSNGVGLWEQNLSISDPDYQASAYVNPYGYVYVFNFLAAYKFSPSGSLLWVQSFF